MLLLKNTKISFMAKRTPAHRAADARYNEKRKELLKRISLNLTPAEYEILLSKLKEGEAVTHGLKRIIQEFDTGPQK